VSPTDTQPYVVIPTPAAARWVTRRVFGRVQYDNLWPAIDAVFSPENPLTFRFVVKPGGSASAIRLKYSGTSVGILDTLVLLRLSWGGRIGQSSVAYQELKGGRTPVTVRYTHLADDRAGFELGPYDHSLPVIVETTLPAGGGLLPHPRTVSRSGAMCRPLPASAGDHLAADRAQLPQENIWHPVGTSPVRRRGGSRVLV
jgi:hypothetical protein